MAILNTEVKCSKAKTQGDKWVFHYIIIRHGFLSSTSQLSQMLHPVRTCLNRPSPRDRMVSAGIYTVTDCKPILYMFCTGHLVKLVKEITYTKKSA